MVVSLSSVILSGAFLVCATRGSFAFIPYNVASFSTTVRQAAAEPTVSAHASSLQRVWDLVQEGADDFDDVQQLMEEVDPETFSQAGAWKKSYTSLRCVVAEVRDQISISVLVLPREYAGYGY